MKNAIAAGVLMLMIVWLAILLGLVASKAHQGPNSTGDADIDKWFHDQLIPGKNQRCCDTSDGQFVEEDVRNGHYWVRWEKTKGEWMEVPDSAVINNQPNKWGLPAVWWGFDEESDSIYIKCYAPGAKM